MLSLKILLWSIVNAVAMLYSLSQTLPVICRCLTFLLLFTLFGAPDCYGQVLPFPPQHVINYLCSNKLLGRGYTGRGDAKAAQYIQERFSQLGLAPLPALNQYYQPFTHAVHYFPKRPKLRLGSRRLKAGSDFVPAADCPSVSVKGTLLVLDSSSAFADFPLPGLERKVVQLQANWHTALAKQGKSGRLAHAKALLLLQPGKFTSTIAEQASTQPVAYIHESGQNGDQVQLIVSAKTDAGYRSNNVVGTVRGTRSDDTTVIICAHYDHLGGLGKQVLFRGANDNASGTTMLLELAAWFAKHPQPYTLVFIAFAGEEAGLKGSTWFVQNPPLDLTKTRMVINLDLMGSGEDGATVVNAPAIQFDFDQLVAINTQLGTLKAIRPRRNAPNSDHYPFSQAGIPAMFMYLQGPYTHYHDVDDRPEALTLAGFEPTYRLLVAFATYLGGG